MSQIGEAVGKLKAFEAKLVARALEDDAFRSKLLENPKKELAAMAGQELPEALQVRIQEAAPQTLTIVVPKKPSAATAKGELSAESLGSVAGGVSVSTAVTTVTETVFGVIAKI